MNKQQREQRLKHLNNIRKIGKRVRKFTKSIHMTSLLLVNIIPTGPVNCMKCLFACPVTKTQYYCIKVKHLVHSEMSMYTNHYCSTYRPNPKMLTNKEK